MSEEGGMSEADRSLERLLDENKGLALFASAVASACYRMEQLPPAMRTANFVAEAIGQFLDAAHADSHPLSSGHTSGETNAAVRLLATSLAAQRSSPAGPGETVH